MGLEGMKDSLSRTMFTKNENNTWCVCAEPLKSDEQAPTWVKHLMIEEVLVFKSEATGLGTAFIPCPVINPLSHSASLCDCQLIIIPRTRVS